MIKKSLFFVLLVLSNIVLEAQEDPFEANNDLVKLSSPRAQAFHIYGEYPVSHKTGIPDISILLYTIETKDLSIPVVLRYHSGGYKPGGVLSNVGLGWTLDYGGRISRTINNKPDEFFDMDIRDNESLNQSVMADALYLRDCSAHCSGKDCRYDIFQYSVDNYSGEFIVNKTGNEWNVNTLENNPLKFTVNTESISHIDSRLKEEIKGFKIVTGKGIGYSYGYGDVERIGNSCFPNHAPTSWLLKEITSPYNSKVKYKYASLPTKEMSSNHNGNYYIIQNDDPRHFNDLRPERTLSRVFVKNPPEGESTWYWMKTIDRIDFDGGYLDFELSEDNVYINAISIYSNKGKLKKRIEFELEKITNSSCNLLRAIKMKDASSNTIQKYSFEYNNFAASTYTDSWGFGNFSGTGFARKEIKDVINGQGISSDIHVGNGSNQSSFSGTTNGLLKKIVYPTGGSTEFRFELNKYKGHEDRTVKTGNGLRIASITNFDNTGKQITTNYSYSEGHIYHDPESPYNYIQISYDLTKETPHSLWVRYRNRRVNNAFNGELLDTKVYYDTISVENEKGNQGITKYIYSYDNPHVWAMYTTQDGFEWPILEKYRGWNNGVLREKHFILKEDLLEKLVRKEKYIYSIIIGESFSNLGVFKLANYGGTTIGDEVIARNLLLKQQNPMFESIDVPIYGTYNYNIQTGRCQLARKVEIDSVGNREVRKETKFKYNTEGLLIESSFCDSKDIPMKSILTYADTYQPTSEMNRSVLDSLNAKNMVAIPLRKEIFKSDGQVSGFINNYRFMEGNSNYMVLGSMYKWNTDDNYVPSVLLDKYDIKGNLLQSHKRNDISVAYLWGYDKQYPVIKAEGCSSSLLESVVQEITSRYVNGPFDYILNQVGELKTLDELTRWKDFNKLLREHVSMKDVALSTYTYDPLTGMTSQTDPNGKITYYEYDDFGRLKRIKDDSGSILKQLDYNYTNTMVSD
ncbi:hypothetical protein EYV94_21450 [Puteibacter caeruleilacunae]|nr:hypothetical protein EYV94_21450 [Puteibacter caeruleilacunae]